MMNEQKRVQKAVDDTLAGLTADEHLAARVLAMEDSRPKQRLRLAVRVMVLAVLLSMAALAAAGGSRFVNWLGEPSPTEEVVSISGEVEPDRVARILKEDEIANAYFSKADEPLRIRVTWPDAGETGWSGATTQFKLNVRDMVHFAQVMADAPYLPVPQWIPEGYEFAGGVILYAYHPGGEMQHVATEVTDDGLTVDLFRAAGEGQIFPYMYVLKFHCGEKTLGVTASLAGSRDPVSDRLVLDDGRVQVFTVSPYENALFIEREDWHDLYLRRVLETEMPYYETWSYEIRAYQEVIVMAEHPDMDAETFLRIFTGG